MSTPWMLSSVRCTRSRTLGPRLASLPAVEDAGEAAQQEVPAAAGRVDHAEAVVESSRPSG